MRRRSLFAAVVVLCLMLTAMPAPMAGSPVEEATWQTGPFPPTNFQYARHDAAFVAGPADAPWANKIYFPGGRTSPGTESPNIWVFDPVTGTYTDTGADVVEDVSNYNANLILDDGTGRGPAIYVVGGPDMTMEEAEGVVQEVYNRVDPNARIIWGAQIDPSMEDKMRTLLVVTGVRSPQIYGRNEKLTPKVQKQFEIDFLK